MESGIMRLLILSGLLLLAACQPATSSEPQTSPVTTQQENPMKTFWNSLSSDMDAIPSARQAELKRMADWIQQQLEQNDTASLVFICTHNSRRSHFGQVWAQVAADQLGIKGVATFSGGTEATACNPRTIEAMMRAGLLVLQPEYISDNPVYRIQDPALSLWSKRFDDPSNVKDQFAAIMTCSDADQACPSVPGAAFRLALPYEDPKVSDGTAQEDSVYDARCRQIAAEMRWAFEQIKR
jgi:protein-tyrosine-phosphatase